MISQIVLLNGKITTSGSRCCWRANDLSLRVAVAVPRMARGEYSNSLTNMIRKEKKSQACHGMNESIGRVKNKTGINQSYNISILEINNNHRVRVSESYRTSGI